LIYICYVMQLFGLLQLYCIDTKYCRSRAASGSQQHVQSEAAENKDFAAENKLFSTALGLFSVVSSRQKKSAENKHLFSVADIWPPKIACIGCMTKKQGSHVIYIVYNKQISNNKVAKHEYLSSTGMISTRASDCADADGGRTKWPFRVPLRRTAGASMVSSSGSAARAGKKARARRAGSGSQQLGSARIGSTLRTSPSQACFCGS
jgi:hypothetical protein